MVLGSSRLGQHFSTLKYEVVLSIIVHILLFPPWIVVASCWKKNILARLTKMDHLNGSSSYPNWIWYSNFGPLRIHGLTVRLIYLFIVLFCLFFFSYSTHQPPACKTQSFDRSTIHIVQALCPRSSKILFMITIYILRYLWGNHW